MLKSLAYARAKNQGLSAFQHLATLKIIQQLVSTGKPAIIKILLAVKDNYN